MQRYIWQSPDWPRLRWEEARLLAPLSRCRLIQGKLLGQMTALDRETGMQAWADLLVEEAVETSHIEGQILDRKTVRSSVARRLGLDAAGLPRPESGADGLVAVLLDATEGYEKPLTTPRLKSWQAALFPTGYSGLYRIIVGDWRGPSPMRIVSGPLGREKVHYEAPPPDRIEEEMAGFLHWWETSRQEMDGILRAGIAHFRFVTIHPFEDGNGRIARAITDMAMAQDQGASRRYYSLSAQIMACREAYYDVLEKTQKGDGDITEWLEWFFDCFEGAIRRSADLLHNVLVKAAFWRQHAQTQMNDRQQKVINRLLDSGKGGFEGGLTTRKYVSMAKVSRSTAQREIRDLLEKGVLAENPGAGRSTSYDLIWPETDTFQDIPTTS